MNRCIAAVAEKTVDGMVLDMNLNLEQALSVADAEPGLATVAHVRLLATMLERVENRLSALMARDQAKVVGSSTEAMPDMVSAEQVGQMLGISSRTVWRWKDEKPGFPRPRQMGDNTTRWVKCEIEAWRAKLPRD